MSEHLKSRPWAVLKESTPGSERMILHKRFRIKREALDRAKDMRRQGMKVSVEKREV